jgi:predicted dinucleotide-binding enzyme
MQIAVLGTGHIGGTLGAKLAAAGHTIVYGSREPNAETASGLAGPRARVTTTAAACAGADAIVLAVPIAGAQSVLQEAGDLSQALIVDCTNSFAGPVAGYSSAGEAVQAWSGSARVVKAFNTAGWEIIAEPLFDGRRADAFICGDDAEAKATVAGLVRDVGMEPVDAGPLANAALTENLARLWGALAYGGLGRNITFLLARR